jgi:penicillin amidase
VDRRCTLDYNEALGIGTSTLKNFGGEKGAMIRRIQFLGMIGLVATLVGLIPAAWAAENVTIYRDTWGVPNIYGDSEEAVSYGLGYAEAEDRPEQIFDNYRAAIGRLSETSGPSALETDYRARLFRSAEVSRENWQKVSPKVRACMAAFQAGIRKYFSDHPEKKPQNYLELEPWMCVAMGRAVIWGWPLGDMAHDLQAGGINPPKIEYHGSNEMVLGPSKTKLGVPIAIVDPHLGFYGMMHFYEARMYGGKIAVAGVASVGSPLVSLGHNEYVSIAMTTGGPDTADVFKETLNPDNPNQYRYDGQWRDGIRRTITINVKSADGTFKPVSREVLYTHHGPVVAEKDGYGYAGALAYANEVGLADEMYDLFTSKNIEDVQKALAMAQLMAQNVMVATVDGDIYYQRTGRVPIRPDGYDYSKPVDGSTSKTEWKGIHPTSDLVQVLNPPCGWMQNCNVSPRVMFRDSPLTPDKYKSDLYMEPRAQGIAYGLHQRAHMAFDLLDAAKNVSIEQFFDIALSPQVYGVRPWQERLRAAWTKADAHTKADKTLAKFVTAILAWNALAEQNSTGILPYHYWKDQLPGSERQITNRLGSPPQESLSDDTLIQMAKDGCRVMVKEVGRIDVKYGDVYRCGRRGGKRTAPAQGGSVDGIATPRALSFGEKLPGERHLMTGGQCAPEIVLMTKPPQSWSAAPLGESDDPNSPHFDDQAIKLVSNRKMKSTYFKDKETLLKNLESKTELTYEPVSGN